MPADVTPVNVTSVRPGGKVHKGYPPELTTTPYPLCRTGSQTFRRTRYVVTNRPVDCLACGPDTTDTTTTT